MHDRAQSEESQSKAAARARPLEAPPSYSTVKRLCVASKGGASTYGAARGYRLRLRSKNGFLLGAEKLLRSDAF